MVHVKCCGEYTESGGHLTVADLGLLWVLRGNGGLHEDIVSIFTCSEG